MQLILILENILRNLQQTSRNINCHQNKEGFEF